MNDFCECYVEGLLEISPLFFVMTIRTRRRRQRHCESHQSNRTDVGVEFAPLNNDRDNDLIHHSIALVRLSSLSSLSFLLTTTTTLKRHLKLILVSFFVLSSRFQHSTACVCISYTHSNGEERERFFSCRFLIVINKSVAFQPVCFNDADALMRRRAKTHEIRWWKEAFVEWESKRERERAQKEKEEN